MKRWIGLVAVFALTAGCAHEQDESKKVAAPVDAAKEAAGKEAAVQSAAEKEATAKATAAKEAAEKEARQHATVSITSTSPQAVEAFTLGYDWFFAGHGDKALAQWREALKLDPGFLLAKAYLRAFSSGTESMNDVSAAAAAGASLPEAERTELQMLDAYKHADTAKGDELAAKIATLAPGDWRAQVRMAGLAVGARKLDEATAAYKHAAELNPKAFAPLSGQGVAAFLGGDHDADVAARRAALAIRPDAPALQDDLAQALIGAGKLDDAAAAAKDETKMAGAGWEAHATLASILCLRGDWAGGIKELDAAHGLATDPNTGYGLREGVAFLQLAARKHAAALKTIATMDAESKGKDANTYVEAASARAVIEADQGKRAAAVKSLNEALARADSAGLSAIGRASARRNAFQLLAWVQSSGGPADAAQAAETSLESEVGAAAATDQDLATLLAFAKGQVALAKGDPAGAAAVMAKCVPEADLCRLSLAAAQEKAGDKAGAAATRAAILASGHTDPFQLWVRSRVPAPAPAKAAKPAKPEKPAKPAKK